jgi:hypothetical protein
MDLTLEPWFCDGLAGQLLIGRSRYRGGQGDCPALRWWVEVNLATLMVAGPVVVRPPAGGVSARSWTILLAC